MAIKIKREWIVYEQEGTKGGFSYHFKTKAEAVKKFERAINNLSNGFVTAIELWDSKRVLKATVKVKRPKS